MPEANNFPPIGVPIPSAAAVAEPAELVSRLRVIEDQPLDQRATAFVHIHDRLHATLEGADASSPNG